jgi:hypothetical protein
LQGQRQHAERPAPGKALNTAIQGVDRVFEIAAQLDLPGSECGGGVDFNWGCQRRAQRPRRVDVDSKALGLLRRCYVAVPKAYGTSISQVARKNCFQEFERNSVGRFRMCLHSAVFLRLSAGEVAAARTARLPAHDGNIDHKKTPH